MQNHNKKVPLLSRVVGVILGLVCILIAGPQFGETIPSFRGFPLTEPARWVIVIVGVIIILYNLLYKRTSKMEKVEEGLPEKSEDIK
ncbi:hypothetical protein [Maridesulfovibrio frigidus]|uniref:hypothetical protein n=1 Tax=Maridesulfovibrio frigidus TaxID=340956 RepID=UPI0004E122F7|nr:hypothetical protein [Maridesulfovibrio frigidus]